MGLESGRHRFCMKSSVYIVFKYFFYHMLHYQNNSQLLKDDRCYGVTSIEGIRDKSNGKKSIHQPPFRMEFSFVF